MDRAQFIRYVESSQKGLRRFLTALCCGDRMLADDIAQDSLVKAYLACDSFDDERNFSAWIHKIAYNTFVTRWRRDRKFEDLQCLENTVAVTDADNSFEYQELYAALDKLSDKERSATLLHYMEGYSAPEIAEITGTSPEAVRQQLSRARQHLRQLLKNKESDG